MNKKLVLLTVLPIFSIALNSCSGNVSLPHNVLPIDKKATTYGDKYKKIREGSLLADGFFRNGFDLCERSNDAHYKGLLDPLDYNKTAEKDSVIDETRFKDGYYWTASQWWTANSLDKATYSYENYMHCYKDDSHLFSVNPNNGTFKLHVNAYQEYCTDYGHQILTKGNWTHLLIEQWFTKANSKYIAEQINNNKKYITKMDITLDKCQWLGSDSPKEGQAAQLLLTFILCTGDMTSSKSGKDYWMWFQMPIFDTRFDTIPAYRAQDSGQVGASDMYVYGLDSKSYMPNKRLSVGQTFCFEYDFTNHMKEAYEDAKQKGYLKASNSFADMKLSYLNFGWELPNAKMHDCGYDIGVTIDNFDIYIK